MTQIRGNDARREVFGWVRYDWANSAFQTTVVTVLAGPYLTALAQHAVGANGTVLRIGPFNAVTGRHRSSACMKSPTAARHGSVRSCSASSWA